MPARRNIESIMRQTMDERALSQNHIVAKDIILYAVMDDLVDELMKLRKRISVLERKVSNGQVE